MNELTEESELTDYPVLCLRPNHLLNTAPKKAAGTLLLCRNIFDWESRDLDSVIALAVKQQSDLGKSLDVSKPQLPCRQSERFETDDLYTLF